ncbi:MAG TPA: dTDP-4-amino-4,6-dideoxygalactose transaminase [Candidatus Dormibacteraeota bacterium]|nr:dTDP-4-amino-4,6-dideoxygalactose transaminase [Candidatus Dormibacteraeota bacterium]
MTAAEPHGTAIEIPFNRPGLAGNEMQYLELALASGHISGDGNFSRRCHELLEQEIGVPKALLTTSCTDALEMAAMLLDLKPGDEVIVPSFTFVSCVNAIALRGARPVFADVRRDTLNIDEAAIERLITKRTRAIMVVHYAGVGCEMDIISELASAHDLSVIEDNAHGLFGAFRGRQLGTFGRLATLSFHETKNITCGEGGALLINDPVLIEQAEIVREKGTNRSQFYRGQVDKYTWCGLGSSYLPSDLLAAYLLAQLEAKTKIQAKRRTVWEYYRDTLSSWAELTGVGLPFVPAHCTQPYHMFYLLMPSLDLRQKLIARLRDRGILAVFHYQPLHVSPMGRRLGGQPGDCPVTEDVSDRLVRLPFFNDLSERDLARIVSAVTAA